MLIPPDIQFNTVSVYYATTLHSPRPTADIDRAGSLGPLCSEQGMSVHLFDTDEYKYALILVWAVNKCESMSILVPCQKRPRRFWERLSGRSWQRTYPQGTYAATPELSYGSIHLPRYVSLHPGWKEQS